MIDEHHYYLHSLKCQDHKTLPNRALKGINSWWLWVSNCVSEFMIDDHYHCHLSLSRKTLAGPKVIGSYDDYCCLIVFQIHDWWWFLHMPFFRLFKTTRHPVGPRGINLWWVSHCCSEFIIITCILSTEELDILEDEQQGFAEDYGHPKVMNLWWLLCSEFMIDGHYSFDCKNHKNHTRHTLPALK
jgi:hypothetical protein